MKTRNISHLLTIPLLACLLLTGRGESGKCGTPRLHELLSRRQPSVSLRVNAVSAPGGTAVRTLETEHFIFYYALFREHKVLTVESDTEILGTADSLSRELNFLTSSFRRDSAVYAAMDRMGAAHPDFVEQCRKSFEAAWDHFIGELGMRRPIVSGSRTQMFGRSAVSGKYPVEIAHIGAMPDWTGYEIYALTYPPDNGGGIILDNDFLYSSNYSGTALDTIRSVYKSIDPPQVINYVLEWKKGIRVTASHEFYHALQYAYTPSPSRYHYWYEASAVAMEERLAPGVNDYLQYLPDLFSHHATFSLNSDRYNDNETYATGIFHTFLGKTLGIDFDVDVWTYLSGNNQADIALQHVFEERGTSLPELFPVFTGPLPYGQRQSICPFPVFSDDLDFWPVLMMKTLRTSGSDTLTLPSMTYEAVRAPDMALEDLVKTFLILDGADLTISSVTGRDVAARRLESDNEAVLASIHPADEEKNFILFSNGSWNKTARIIISEPPIIKGNELSVFPNPLSLNNSFRSLFFARNPGGDPESIRLFTESGRLIRQINLAAGVSFTAWDLTDSDHNMVTAGVYYYQAGNRPLQPVLLHYDIPSN